MIRENNETDLVEREPTYSYTANQSGMKVEAEHSCKKRDELKWTAANFVAWTFIFDELRSDGFIR